jgi:hypothetical protein
MSPSNDIEFAQVLKRSSVATCLRLFPVGVLLALFGASPALSQTTYSDSWLDDSGSGTMVSAGVTDGSYTHSYVVDTTVSSPNGRSAFGSRRRTGYARADVTLAWDWDDPGDYFTESEHWARCPGDDLNYYPIGTTSDSFRVGISNAVYSSAQCQSDGCLYQIVVPCDTTCKSPTIKVKSPSLCHSYAIRKTVFHQTFIGPPICFNLTATTELSNFGGLCFDHEYP